MPRLVLALWLAVASAMPAKEARAENPFEGVTDKPSEARALYQRGAAAYRAGVEALAPEG